MRKRKVEVCMTPELIGQYDVAEKNVVLIDILRASSTIVTALAEGMHAVIPVASLDEALAWPSKLSSQKITHPGADQIIRAAERNGAIAPGFTYGNSPLTYRNGAMKGKTLVLTTTNGTGLVNKSKGAAQIIASAFLNLKATANYLNQKSEDVLLFCAGWKGRVNLEDSLFAGAITDALGTDWHLVDDSSLLCLEAWRNAKNDLNNRIEKSSHYRRLAHKGAAKDIDFCLHSDKYNVVPFLNNEQFECK